MNSFWKSVQGICVVVGALFIVYFFLLGLFVGASGTEPFDPTKMSQVSVWPQQPILEKARIAPQVMLPNLPPLLPIIMELRANDPPHSGGIPPIVFERWQPYPHAQYPPLCR